MTYRLECHNCAHRYERLEVHHCGHGWLRIDVKVIGVKDECCPDFTLKPLSRLARFLPWSPTMCFLCGGVGLILPLQSDNPPVLHVCDVCDGRGRK